jgi:hypothetical protein
MKYFLIILLTGCAAQPSTYCKAGYEHTYSYNGGYRQIYDVNGNGVPCKGEVK